MRKRVKSDMSIILYFLIVLFFSGHGWAEAPKRVLILPMTVHAEKDLSFLQRGIQDMLATRLAQEGEITVIGKEETAQVLQRAQQAIDEKFALRAAASLKADYVIFGSLTVLGDNISTDARFFDVSSRKPLVTFNQFGRDQADAIAHINQFAEQINRDVFQRRIPPPAATGTKSKDQTPLTTDKNRQHPEKLLSGGIRSSESPTGVVGPGSDINFEVWKSRKFRAAIRGIDVGDVTGNGQKETVFITTNTVHIYRKVGEQFSRIGEHQGSKAHSFTGVGTADINQNGKAEIYITSHAEKIERLFSFVLEWNGSRFEPIGKNLNWHLRVIRLPDRGNILLGQERAFRTLFKPGVFEMMWSGGRLTPAQDFILPPRVNIYGFTYGDILNNNREMVAAFTRSDYIRIIDQSGAEEWSSSERYGGTENHMDYIPEVQAIYDPDQVHRYYIPQKLHIVDFDGDGLNELIAVRNHDASKILKRFRLFKNGQIECLAWKDLGMELKWRTQKVAGHISDYVIADMNNDGKKELVFSVAARTGPVLGKDKSYIVSWGIQENQAAEITGD